MGYEQKFSTEIFHAVKVSQCTPQHVYKLTYTIAISKVSFTIKSTLRSWLSPAVKHRIDKIVCMHNKGSIKQHLINQKGYNHTSNYWVNTSDIKKI